MTISKVDRYVSKRVFSGTRKVSGKESEVTRQAIIDAFDRIEKKG